MSLEDGFRDGGLTRSRYQSRAFLLLPMCANIGTIIGPMMGGLTSDPAGNYPSLFGGIAWLEKFPYSPPNIISAIFLASAACAIFFGLEEARIFMKLEDNLLTVIRPMSVISRMTSGSNSVEELCQCSEEYSNRRRKNAVDMNLFLILMMAPLLNTALSRRDLANTSPHATRTNFLSVESLLTMSSVH